MPVPYGNGNVHPADADQFVISYEMIHDTRVVPLNGRPHIASGIRQYLGDSRGRWTATRSSSKQRTSPTSTGVQGGNGNGLRHSEAMRMVEHFTRIADDVAADDMTMDDRRPTRSHGRSQFR